MDTPPKNATTTRGRPFEPGNSGRPKGARNRATLAAEALLDGEAEALTRKAIELALAGGPIALRLCLDRILSPRRERPTTFALPELRSAARCRLSDGRDSGRSCLREYLRGRGQRASEAG